jgi:hypothetical protein
VSVAYQFESSKMIHELKTWPIPFQAVKSGEKKAEFRLDDRGYRIGDVLILREWDPETEAYTDERLYRRVTHIVRGGQFGIPSGYVMMSIEPTQDRSVWKPSDIKGGKNDG